MALGYMAMLEDLKRAAWARTNPVQNQPNSWDFRKDVLGNLIRYADFGNRQSPFGWELEQFGMRSTSADNDNVQALHWKANTGRPEPQLRLMTVAESEAQRRGR